MRRLALFFGGAVTLLVLAWASWPAAGFPAPFGPCLGPACPDEPYPDPNNGEFVGADEAINVFVGGSMSVVGGAAESEGNLAVLGDLDVARSTPGGYNIGVAGVGSRIAPPSGTDHGVVGGDITVDQGSTIFLGGSDADETRWGNLVHGGVTDISQGDRLDLTPSGQLINRDDSARLAQLRDVVIDLSACAATYADTGSWAEEFGTVTFTGDGTSDPQVFTVDTDLGSPSATVAFAFEQIPAGATTITAPGVNGRVLLAGSLVHGGGGGGEELHAYPFVGTLPPCSQPGDDDDDDGDLDDADVDPDADVGADADAADQDGTDAPAGDDGSDNGGQLPGVGGPAVWLILLGAAVAVAGLTTVGATRRP